MKRFFFILVAFSISILANAQSLLPTEFFGLEFGKKYSPEQLILHVGANGIYVDSKTDIKLYSIDWKGYFFQNVTYEGQQYPLMTLLTRPDDVLGLVLFTIPESNIPEGQTLDSVYDVLLGDLSSKYVFHDYTSGAKNAVAKCYIDGKDNLLMISRQTNDGQESIAIAYIAMTFGYNDALNNLTVIQDTFFGMTLGSKQTAYSIKSAVGYKGTYLLEDPLSFGKVVTFKDIMFAGNKWDFGNFSISDTGEFYELSVNKSLAYFIKDDRQEADRLYELFKSKLAEKYGKVEEVSDADGKSISYYSGNGICLSLSNKKCRSVGGDYRLYVKLEYSHFGIIDKLSKRGDDEL